MRDQLPKHLLEKYVKGECTPAEEAVVREWYNSFVNDDDHVSSLNSAEKARLKTKLKTAIDHTILLDEIKGNRTKSSLFWRYRGYSITGIAAMLLIAYDLGVFGVNPNQQSHTTEIVSITNNTKGIQEQVLSDGSHVWLYPGAKIKFGKRFTGATREVSLSGESFFDITKNPNRPFIINSAHMVTKVWGTSFRVNDTEKDNSAAVVQVLTGKVSVKALKATTAAHTPEVMLHPNEQVVYHIATETLKPDKIKSDANLSIWKKVNLSFDNKPLREVIPVLNKHFNVYIPAANDKLNSYLLNADFNGLNLVAIMEILNKTFDISYEIHNTDIILKNNK